MTVEADRARSRSAAPESHPPHALPGEHPALVGEASVSVDCSTGVGPMSRMWTSFGYDEINWTYTPTGKQTLTKIGGFGDRPYHVRPHYVFCSGTGFGLPHWGNGNVYHEDADGNPSYDFAIADQVYDAIVGAGHHPLVELAFTPLDLVPEEAKREFPFENSPTAYSGYEAGWWSYPPKDYARWGELVAALATHCLERYGAQEVSQWLWELWNEPDIFYWRGTPEQFYELYDVTSRAIRQVLPEARVGGPTVTGGSRGVPFLRGFLAHCAESGAALDFVSFHTKGSAFRPWRVYGPLGAPAPERQSPSTLKMLREVRRLLDVVGEFPQYADLPCVVDECDASVPAHWGVYDNANFGYRNTEYYAVFQAKLMKKLHDLNAVSPAQVSHATTWSFYFEGERYFEGTRALVTTSGIDKPVLNAYRMFARLGDERLAATSSASWPLSALDDAGTGMAEEVDVLATRDDDGQVSVLVWRHVDDQYATAEGPTAVTVRLENVPADVAGFDVDHWRIDHDHSNAHTVWQGLGAPQGPTPEQVAAIRERAGLERHESPRRVTVAGARVELSTDLPLPSVSLFVLTPVR
ncbi:GH39 family glycosyl hydrolase [Actinopolymorpha pittospori]|uniref:Xylan 1,4-beta-xylosidase n=1 Tax=Actinopolymorpha pittospori TaxID=648752 RepID=A0A927N1X3_9ACTN|nr:glycoside hydrolase [Actinopolymorpha pittospori]MBE1607407.1 xylan 1,4-beta-xylosidase [Actinopolymorpha pittospori]